MGILLNHMFLNLTTFPIIFVRRLLPWYFTWNLDFFQKKKTTAGSFGFPVYRYINLYINLKHHILDYSGTFSYIKSCYLLWKIFSSTSIRTVGLPKCVSLSYRRYDMIKSKQSLYYIVSCLCNGLINCAVTDLRLF